MTRNLLCVKQKLMFMYRVAFVFVFVFVFICCGSSFVCGGVMFFLVVIEEFIEHFFL